MNMFKFTKGNKSAKAERRMEEI
jgi:hypothetical protein